MSSARDVYTVLSWSANVFWLQFTDNGVAAFAAVMRVSYCLNVIICS